jgi:hypothetical protein
MAYAALPAQVKSINAETNETFSKSNLFIGTQVPLQFTLGYDYRFTNRFSSRIQAGLLTKPYEGLIVNSLEAFGMDKYLSRVIKKAFKSVRY